MASGISEESISKESEMRSRVRNASLLVLQLSRQLSKVKAEVPVPVVGFLTRRSFFEGGS